MNSAIAYRQPPPPPPREPGTLQAGVQPKQRPRSGLATSAPPLQTLDRVLQKELKYGRIGFPQGHYRAPTNQLPAAFQAELMRGRGKSRLRDMTMIPTTLRAWESTVERKAAAGQRRGAAAVRPGSAASSGKRTEWPGPGGDRQPGAHRETGNHQAPAAPESRPSEPRPLTPFEMRKFLHHSQRYFLAVRKDAFAVGPQPTDIPGGQDPFRR